MDRASVNRAGHDGPVPLVSQSRHQAGESAVSHGVSGGAGRILGPGAVLALQRQAGNRAVTGILLQRVGPFNKKPKVPKKTHEKQSAKEMTSEEGTAERARVKDQVQQFLDLRKSLVQKGMAPDAAAQAAFAKAPPDIRRWLPLHDEFDIVKQDVDRVRKEEGGLEQAKISERLTGRAQELGYKVGVGDPMEASPEDIEKELNADQAFRRQMERRAERLLLGDRAAAEATLKSATESSDEKAIAEARRKLESLQGPQAVQAKLVEIALEAAAAVDALTKEKIAAKKVELKVAQISDAEKWRQREKAKKSIRGKLEGGIDTRLTDAGSAADAVGTVGSGVKSVGFASSKVSGAKKLTPSQASTLTGSVSSIGLGLQTVGGIFSQVVKLVNRVNDYSSDKLDKDAPVEIAGDSLKLVNQAVSAAQGSLQVALKFNDALSHDPGFAAAIPGLGLAVGVIGFVGNVVAVVPPTDRLYHTVASRSSASTAGSGALAGALGRTVVENALQVTTEIVGATANGIRVGANIAELATAGGFGAPAAVKLGATALELAKGAADAVTLEALRSKTQDARKKGALQIEGSGKKLIKTDIGYAVDTIILAGKRALAKQAEGQKLTSQEEDVIALVESYGVGKDEAQRLSLREVHQRMLDKLDQDDEQQTAKMKLQEGFDSLKEGLASLAGGGKDDTYQDLDSYARQQGAKAQAEADMTTGDKVKSGLATAGGYAKKVVTAPAKITKLGDMASEKAEKVKRLQEIKNLVNYKERSDRGLGFAVSEFGVDLEPSIQKLRKFIVATQSPEQASVYLKELNTLSEQQTITKKVGQNDVAKKRSAEKVSDRVISPELAAKAASLSFGEVRDQLKSSDLGLADREYLKQLLAKKAFG